MHVAILKTDGLGNGSGNTWKWKSGKMEIA